MLISGQFYPCWRKLLNKMWIMRKLITSILPLVFAATISGPAVARPSGNTHKPPAQSAAVVTQKVIDFLSQQASSYPGSARITVDTPRLQRHPVCRDLQVFLPNGQRLRSRLSVGVRCMAPTPWTTRVAATLAISGFFYVPNRTLDPGETVSLDDLIPREGDILSLARGVVVDPSQLIDQVVTQRIPSGTPIKAGALRSPMSVQRGQVVITEARGPGFVATGSGQTLQDGAPGEQIRIRTDSGNVISATVMDAHTVQVMM